MVHQYLTGSLDNCGRRSWGNNASDGSAYQLGGFSCVLDLVGDSYFMLIGYKFAHVTIDTVSWNTTHCY